MYYQQTNLTAAGYVTALPGLLVAWLVFLVLFAGWLPSAGTVVQRFLPTFAVGGVGTLLVANHFLPIFPGSASTAPLQLALLVRSRSSVSSRRGGSRSWHGTPDRPWSSWVSSSARWFSSASR
ncbi:hypothetical protein [Haladaptatus sp. R4]|uniref:hypothetical protein n=1 Tax=Haladaptatus sp. R4 TaxID=1679489 RepID=UPI001CBEA2E0|nr:hypothetical protein [Haladaptatus sp. R4]